jgi:hypothetical protein
MKTEPYDPSTEELQARSALARSRVAADVEQLHAALEPARLKDRAFEAAERSAAQLALRALKRWSKAPGRLARYAKKHPVVSVSLTAAVVLLGWRALARRRH